VARRKRLLTPEVNYGIWVQVLTRQLTKAEAAVRWGVDPTTVMKLRRVAKEGALAAFAAARPGRPRQPEEDAELAAAKPEVVRLGETVKELAVENLLLRGKSSCGLIGGVPRRVDAATKSAIIELIDQAIEEGWPGGRPRSSASASCACAVGGRAGTDSRTSVTPRCCV